MHGTGSHDKTGRHCLPNDPNGKLDIAHDAGYWLRDEHGDVTADLPAHLLGRLHVPQRSHVKPETWNNILAAMLSVQDAHGWDE